MKKKYLKPILIVESFQLDVGVASCSGDNGIPIGFGQDDCQYVNGDEVYFSSQCMDDIVNPNEFGDGYCYHGFNNAGVTFISS